MGDGGDAALTFLLDNLADLVKYHVNLISGADAELTSLQDELKLMRTLLEDASRKRYKEAHFKEWERKLRNVVYDAEDAIDTCITEAAIANKRGRVRKFLSGRPVTLAEKIKSLREGSVKAVLGTSAMLKAQIELVPESDRIDEIKILRNKPPREENVVGFEDETAKLVGYLTEESKGLDVVTIHGMPGLGKTTVAWKIYKHGKIQYSFPTLIWVVVSNEFNKREVLLTILKKFTNTDIISDLSVEVLERMVKDYLERTKFLLILDDVWTPEVWKAIFAFLPKDITEGGRVLITTRNEKVGWHANPNRSPHMLRFLTVEESSMLLRIEVFNSRESFPDALETYGKLIAKRCDGLPLAIIVIGGILVDKTPIAGVGGVSRSTREEWKLISEDPDTYISREDKTGSMEKMISLSYTSLPHDLRYCFLYVGGMFPEDSEISAWELIQLWIAEGFIKQKSGKTLEATAHDNLKELINRNLVMVDKIKPNGDVKTCKIHDTIREFCKFEAGYENQNLFQEVKKGAEGELEYNKNQKYRRLSVHSYVKDFFLKTLRETKLPETRSFLSFTKPIDLETKDIPAFTDVFELLRIFNAKTIKFPKFPIKFTELVHLRYLTLSGKELKLIPTTITKLWNLQTLLIDTQLNTLEIKANIWLMINLRHVKSNAAIVLTCKEVKGDGGTKLQTLDKLSPESCTVEVFKKAKNLRTLGIRGDISKLADSRCLEELVLLEKLKLENFVNHEAAGEKPLHSLPRAFPENLKFLTLSKTFLSWSHMSTVGNIHTLEVLKLKDNAFRGECWDSVAGGFHKLEYLYIIRTRDLMFWRIRGDPFPSLKTIVIKNCENLESVPKDLMRKLEKLELHRVTPFAVTSAREVEKEINEEIKQESGTKRGGFKLIVAPGDA